VRVQDTGGFLISPEGAADRSSVSGPPTAGTSEAAQTPTGIVPPTGNGRSGFLSDVIVELGFASRETVEQAVRAARSPGSTVARVLVELGAITEEQLARATAERYGIDYVDLSGFEVDPTAANLIKPSAARRYRAVPIARVGKALLVAMADPADALGLNDIALMTKLEVRPAVAGGPALDALLEKLPLDTGGWDEVREPEDEAVEAPEPVEVGAETGDSDAATARLRQERDELRADLLRVRAEAEVRSKELELLRAELASAEMRAETAEAQAGEAPRLAEELAAADERAEQARQALSQMRDEAERERERAAMAERDLREQLGDEERRRSELESHLSEVEGAAFAAERAFEELRLAQGRMRGALGALADPDDPTAAGSSDTAARTP
jgi:Type II secretion system (T2SS), protein E, N-terminal domain